MKRRFVFTIILLFLISACNSNSQGLNIKLDESCDPDGKLIHFEGLYRDDERNVCGNYYCWSYIRFFDDCTYQMGSSYSDTAARAATDFLKREKDQRNGRYSIEGTTIKMLSAVNESIGTINGDTLEIDLYVFNTKKNIKHTYVYTLVKAISEDYFKSFQGEQILAPTP